MLPLGDCYQWWHKSKQQRHLMTTRVEVSCDLEDPIVPSAEAVGGGTDDNGERCGRRELHCWRGGLLSTAW